MRKKSVISACVLAAMTALGLIAPTQGQYAYEAYKSKMATPKFRSGPSMAQQVQYMNDAVGAI
jgi:hypothetical protein